MEKESNKTIGRLPLLHPFIIKYLITLIYLIFLTSGIHAQAQTNYAAEVSASDPVNHFYHIRITCKTNGEKTLTFNMCAWTPGFYEIADFGNAVSGFKATDGAGNVLHWNKAGKNSWQVEQKRAPRIVIDYNVKADNPFIANANLDKDYGYFIPGALVMYPDGKLQQSLVLKIVPFKEWPQNIAIAAHILPGHQNSYYFANFDRLFDTPVLMGKIDRFPESAVYGRKIRFFSHSFRILDPEKLMANIGKIAKAATDVIGAAPFESYDFLAVGLPIHAFGGIEHFNSASLIMSNDTSFLSQPKARIGMYGLLAHEYFHLYNVKRIRPIALGPFDYSKENYTKMLWVSEGFTNYYQYLILKRANLITSEQALEYYQQHIKNYENSPGHYYQTLTDASLAIWSQAGMPQKRSPEETAKTISVYDKGCILGMLLDLKIRHETKNRKSLDDVMRALYNTYYLHKKRGFTDLEFRQTCQLIAHCSLTEIFSYASTVKAVDYPKYMNYAGLSIDTSRRLLPELSIGAELVYDKSDSCYQVKSVSWPSSSFTAGLIGNDKINSIDGIRANNNLYKQVVSGKKPGDQLTLEINRGGELKTLKVTLERQYEKSYRITKIQQLNPLQKAIFNGWMR